MTEFLDLDIAESQQPEADDGVLAAVGVGEEKIAVVGAFATFGVCALLILTGIAVGG